MLPRDIHLMPTDAYKVLMIPELFVGYYGHAGLGRYNGYWLEMSANEKLKYDRPWLIAIIS